MRLRNQCGQTGIAVLALIVALIALGISVYTYVHATRRVDHQSQLTKLEELIERGRREMADALKRLEEQIRGRQQSEPPPRQ